ncbi:MAG: bifunctional 5,10-methylene-tetrahydrofolate dehydrogenase/5,10-methylene-tetrahydrofolate cyclohydrolase [Chloroflexi bacterium]|nr:bifunctional 5,10-methylene-tetrahydrofolate dehydrogenase/5,10-methylene-tetrahydrofolate cyclohydrolase [Chloroflexota bacterium]
MTATIINGTRLAQEVRSEVARDVQALRGQGVTPGMAAVLIGDNPASASYVRSKERTCQEVGIFTETFHLPQQATREEVLPLIQRLNRDSRFHGILTQLPLPSHLSEADVVHALSPAKDVDCLHPYNVGLLALGQPIFVPATPLGIQHLLLRSGYDLAGKHVVVCGRSNIVGKPMAMLLAQKAKGANATVTLCHTGTPDLAAFTRQADILIAAMGSPRCIKAPMVKPGAVVIDVGLSRVDDPSQPRGYRLEGDVDFQAVSQVAAAITPVPGGVGPMTVAMLLVNTVKAARLSA